MSDPVTFRLGFTQAADFDLTRLQRRAAIFGGSQRVADAPRVLFERLRTTARECGEPIHNLHGMKTVIRLTFHDRIRIEYAVHDIEPVVVVRKVEPEPGHPLHRQE